MERNREGFKTKKYYYLDRCPSPAASGHNKIIMIISIIELQINIIHNVGQKKEKKSFRMIINM